jgi:hypothetical protein
MSMKCVIRIVSHADCTNHEACLADPSGIVHSTAVSTACSNDTVEGEKYCTEHLFRFKQMEQDR